MASDRENIYVHIYKNKDLRHTSSLPRDTSLYPYIDLLFYLLPLLFPTGGFLSCSSGPPVPNPEVCVLETPKVNPADALMPGLLKLKPEVLDVPNPEKQRFKSLRSKYFKFSQQAFKHVT